MLLNKRWYDKDDNVVRMLEIVKGLSDEEQEGLTFNVLQFVKLIREKNGRHTENPVSVGKNKILGLYKSSQKRRWYDNNLRISNILNALSTLPSEDCENIAKGILVTLSLDGE